MLQRPRGDRVLGGGVAAALAPRVAAASLFAKRHSDHPRTSRTEHLAGARPARRPPPPRSWCRPAAGRAWREGLVAPQWRAGPTGHDPRRHARRGAGWAAPTQARGNHHSSRGRFVPGRLKEVRECGPHTRGWSRSPRDQRKGRPSSPHAWRWGVDGDDVRPMGLAWLQPQAEIAERQPKPPARWAPLPHWRDALARYGWHPAVPRVRPHPLLPTTGRRSEMNRLSGDVGPTL
jgi:hypothetical protein